MSIVVGTVAAGVLLAVAVGEVRPSRHPSWRPVGGVADDTRPGFAGLVASRVATVRRAVVALVRPPDPVRGVTDMVAFLDAVARALRGGAGLHAAVRAAVPDCGVHARGLAGLVGSMDAGEPLAVALDRWRGPRPSPEVSLAAAVLGFGIATGGSVARAVDGAAATLRERLALAGETRVLATQARASALVVGGAPVAFTAVVVLADPRVGDVLFGSLLGLACLGAGVLLEVACVAWMRRLVAQAADL